MEARKPSFSDYHEDDLVGTVTAAVLLVFAAHTLENMRCTGGGPQYSQIKRGGKVMYRIGDLKRWVDDHTRGSTS